VNVLGSHVTAFDPKARAMMGGIAQGFAKKGMPAAQAAKQGYAAMFGMVQQQAAILSFLDVFRLLGVIFLLLVPLVLLMKRPAKAPGSMGAH